MSLGLGSGGDFALILRGRALHDEKGERLASLNYHPVSTGVEIAAGWN